MFVNHGLHIEEITVSEALEDLRREWDDLLLRDSGASIFQTWEWISTSWHWFGRGKRLLLLCVRDGERLVGLAPMEITRMYGLPLRRLQFIGAGVSDYLDFILDDTSADKALNAIYSWVLDNSSFWDLVDLQNLPEYSPTAGLIAGSRWQVVKGEICPYMPLADTWDEMLGRFGKKMRSNLGYYERLMRRNFDFEMSTLSMDELEEGMSAFFRLHTARWRKRFLPGMLTGARRQGFHREVACLCLKRGWLHLHGLRLDGRLRAVLYCFAFNGRGYYYLGGFEPELSKYSPGSVLTGYAIRQAIEKECTEFDFLRGNEPYKSRWTSDSRTNRRMVISREGMAPTLSNSICRLEQSIEDKVKHALHGRFGAG